MPPFHRDQLPQSAESPAGAFRLTQYAAHHFGEDPSLIPIFWAPGWNSVQATNKFQQEVGGPLRGGDPGVRLLEADESATPAFFTEVPGAFQSRNGQWLALPLYHIFGSEELSMLSPPLAGRAPQPYLAVHPDDLTEFGLQAGEIVRVSLSGVVRDLQVLVLPGLARGLAGIPIGLATLRGCGACPAYGLRGLGCGAGMSSGRTNRPEAGGW